MITKLKVDMFCICQALFLKLKHLSFAFKFHVYFVPYTVLVIQAVEVEMDDCLDFE